MLSSSAPEATQPLPPCVGPPAAPASWYSAEPLAAVRRRLIARSGAPLELRTGTRVGSALHVTGPVEAGQVIFQERPWAVVKHSTTEADCHSVQLCCHCLAPAGTATEQLQFAAICSGISSDTASVLELPDAALAGAAGARSLWMQKARRCPRPGCGAVWCSEQCEQAAAAHGWHGKTGLCSDKGAEFLREAEASGNPVPPPPPSLMLLLRCRI